MESPTLPSGATKKQAPTTTIDAASLASSRSADVTVPATMVDDEGKRSYPATAAAQDGSGFFGLFTGPNVEARKQRYRVDAVALDVKPSSAHGELGDKTTPSAEVEEEDNTGLHRTLGWKGCSFHMGAYAIALGVLSIPRVVATIGWGTFILLSLVFAALTWYTGMSYYRLQQRFPGVHSLEDAGQLLFGPLGGFIFGWSQLLFAVFLSGNHVILGAVAFHALGWTGTCAIALNAVFAIISFVFTLPRSYKLFAYFAMVSLTSIIIVVIIAMIGSAITGPINQPPGTPSPSTKAFGSLIDPKPSFLDGVLSVTNLFVSFGSSPAYLPLMAEMHSPKRDFPRSLAVLTAFQTILYLIVGGVIYHNLGQYVTSPSLSSLSPTLQKVSYGIGLGTILVAGCEAAQVASKQLYKKTRKARPSLFKTRQSGWTVWIVINALIWTCAWILAECLPFFSSFLSVEASAFWSAFLAFAAFISIFVALDKRAPGTSWKHASLLPTYAACAVVLCITTFIAVCGMWSASVSIKDSYAEGVVGSPFSCEVGTA